MRLTLLPFALAAAFGATAALAQDGATSEMLDLRSNFASGEEAYNKVCSRCHTPGVGPDLSINEYDPDTVKFFVRNGMYAMPAFPASAISDETLVAIADYMAKNVYKGEAQ